MEWGLLEIFGSAHRSRGTWYGGESDRLARALVFSIVLLGFTGCSLDSEVGEANPMSLYQSTQPGIPSLIRLDRAEGALDVKASQATSTEPSRLRE